MWNDIVTPDLAIGRSGRGVRLEVDGFTNETEDSGDSVQLFPSRRCAPNQVGCDVQTNQNNDGEFINRTHPNRPVYKPQYWNQVQKLDYDLNYEDPLNRCYPPGLPRVGRPRKIVQTANEIIFFYGVDTRIIPLDGRAHDPDAIPTFYGHSVGHWDGDTLVVDVRGFNDTTWLAGALSGGGGGYLHSFEMRVIERLRREGNTLHYQATVEDPEVLLEPWVMNKWEMRLNPDPQATVQERTPCLDIDRDITASRIRH
jgi:hypothetical protein